MNNRSAIKTISLFVFAGLLFLGKAIASPPVVMKVLVLAGSTSETSYQAITTILSQIGVPYQAVVLNGITPDSSGNRLSKVSFSNSATGQGSYQGIILTDSTFSACNSGCLSTMDWTTLNTYAAQFSVRIASYYTSPAAQWGLLPANSGASYTGLNPLNVILTGAGAAVFPYLNSGNSIPVGGQGVSSIRAYLATTTAAANETTTSLMTAGPFTVAATHTTADGREILALTMDNAANLIHSQAFGYGVINWVTKGVFLGSRKVYLNPETDDFLLGNWIYAPSQHPDCEASVTCPTYYMTGPDLQAHASWQANLRTDPQFQSYQGTFAVNGVGSTWFASSDPIFAAVKSLNTEFWWLSHTWDHPDLDCYSQSKNGTCVAATLAQSLSELNQNISAAPSLGITLDRLGMVTPFNSGLSDANFLKAASQAGIQYIVATQYPAAPNTIIANKLVPSILEVTRMNNDLFYDASSPDSGVYGSWPDEYNSIYGPNGTAPTYSQNQTYSQILDNLSQEFFQTNMLTYAPYPLAFHIANIATYDGTHSAFTDVMDATVRKYESLMTLPVISLDLEDVGALLTARTNYNASGVIGVYTPGVSVVLTTTKAATIPITGACSQSACGTYGGQIQDNVAMAASSTLTLSLTPGGSVALSSLTINPASVTAGSTASGKIALSGAAPPGGVSVVLSSGNASAAVPASVTVAAGSATATFTITTGSVAAATSTTITAGYGGASQTAALTITPATAAILSSALVNPSSVTGGTSANGTIALTASAQAGGALVSLSSNNTAASVPASVTITAGSTTATFAVTTTAVTSAASITITATYNGVSKTAALTITPSGTTSLASVILNPTSVSSGASATGTLTLSGTAPAGGAVVSLSSNNAAAKTPASVTVAAGSTTASFAVSTSSVAYTTPVTLTASYNGSSRTAALTIAPSASVALASVLVSPASVTSGTTATGTVTLSTAAPAGGIAIELWTTGTVAFVPSQVTVAAGLTSATFNVTTNYTTGTLQDTVTAFYNGSSTTAPITVTP